MTEKSKTALDDVAAEASAEQAPPASADGSVTLTLKGSRGSAEITVLPILDWIDDAQECLGLNNFRGWARAVLDDENFLRWVACAPRNSAAREFFLAWDAAVDRSGESSAS